MKRVIGVTVLPEYVQSESIEQVLDNLTQRAGVTAIGTSPYVMELADEQTGVREPPADAGAGKVRLLDRPLWGHRELHVRTAPSFQPDLRLYAGLRYQPPPASPLTERDGAIVGRFLDAAHERGLKAYFQVQAAIPPGYRVQFGGPEDDDAPRLPDGRIPPRRVANNASLASPHILAYQRALIRDLHQAYPTIDGIRFDWPEYPPYLLDSAFLDFSSHAERAASRLGFDFEAMRGDAARLYQRLNSELTNSDLRWFLDQYGGSLEGILVDYPGVLESLRFKAALVDELLADFRATMTEVGGGEWELTPSAFPPPWSIVSGMHFNRAARHCDALSVKLYGMHWLMMLRFYGDQIRDGNSGLDESLLAKALLRLLDIADDEGLPTLDDYCYPGPEEPHRAGTEAQKRKISEAQRGAGDTPIHVLAHGYGPLDDFVRRLQAAYQASPHGLWLNRYGYLSDEKLNAVGAVAESGER